MNKKNQKKETSQEFFPPVVAVLGHVDHGKTTLLDAIRKTNIAIKEFGGITQKIGASSIELLHEGKKRRITFIDTPGHEAFSKMRSRGAQAADIGLLIVSSVDGVMPQTKESIKLLQESKIPLIVVLTKVDLPGQNIEKTKSQLSKENVVLEGLGGDVPIIEVSAKTGKGIKELLELILLVFEVHKDLFVHRSLGNPFSGIVIESKMDQKAGSKVSFVIKEGKILVSDRLVCEGIKGKVRAILNDKGEHLKSAEIGDAVEVLGFEKVPNVGAIIAKAGESIPKEESLSIKEESRIEPFSYEGILPLILCADTLGSLEAIVGMLPKGTVVISKKTGDIESSDVLLAKSAKAIVIGFNIRVKPEVQKLAGTEKVLIKNYNIIYELIDEITDVVEGKKEALIEEVLGAAKILATFPYEKTKVLGVSVLDGRVAKGDKVNLTRGDIEIGRSTITSVRQGKNPVSKVEKGQEAGVVIAPLLDFTIGDVLICHR